MEKKKPSGNQTLATGGVGLAVGNVAVWLIPQVTELSVDPTQASLLTSAIGLIAAWLARYLPQPG